MSQGKRGRRGVMRRNVARCLTEALEPRMLLTGAPDLSQLKSNLDSTFQQANNLIQNTVSMTPLPIVGSKIGSAINSLTSLQSSFDSALSSISSSSQATDVQMALEKALPGATVTIVQDAGTSGTTDEFSITQTVASAVETNPPALNFSLGLPGLLKGNVGFDISLGYSYSLDFGIDSTSGFFVSTDPSKTNFTFNPTVTIKAGSQLTGTFGPLAIVATDYTGDPQNLSIGPTMLSATFTASLTAPDNGTMLTPATLSKAGVDMTLEGNAHLALNATVGAAGSGDETFNDQFPSLSMVLTVDWPFPEFSLSSTTGVSLQNFGSEPTVGFNNISLSLGSAIDSIIEPVMNDINRVLKPIKPIADFITEPMPLFNDIGPLKSLVGTDAEGVVTVGNFFGFLASLEGGGEAEDLAEGAVDFAQFVEQFYTVYNGITDLSTSGTQGILLGSYTIGGNGSDIGGGSNIPGDLRDASTAQNLNFSSLASDASTSIENQLNNLLGGLSGGSDFLSDIFGGPPASEPVPGATFGSSGQYSFDSISADYGLQFPIFTNPGSILGMLVGQTVPLVTMTTPPVDFGVPFQVNIPIFGPLVIALKGDLDNNDDAVLFGAQFSCGYDTYGLTDGNPLDGFYINDKDSFVGLGFGIAADAAIDLVIVGSGRGRGDRSEYRAVDERSLYGDRQRADALFDNAQRSVERTPGII